MVKAVFFDVDGTLVDSETHTIPNSTLSAIRQLKKTGYKTGIATGRCITSVYSVDGLDLSLFDAYVLNNGACVFKNRSECIFDCSFGEKDVYEIIDFAEKNNITLILETINESFAINELNDYVFIAKADFDEPLPITKKWEREKIVKINAFQKMKFDFGQLAEKKNIKIMPCPTTCYDIAPVNVSKLNGIYEIMKHWKLDKNEFMCFGDQDNDMEMIQGAEVGIAVKDKGSSENLQKAADYICDAPRRNGIYNFLKQYNYI